MEKTKITFLISPRPELFTEHENLVTDIFKNFAQIKRKILILFFTEYKNNLIVQQQADLHENVEVDFI